MQGLLVQEEIKPALKKPSRKKLILILSMLLAVGAIATAAVMFMAQPKDNHKSGSQAEVMAPVATVTTQPVSRIPVVSSVVASGTVAARHTVDIGSELTGLRVTLVNVDEGDAVRKGQVLARLNSEVLSAQLSREQANLAGALANVEKARQPNRLEDILGLQAAYQQSQAAISQAESNVRRLEANLHNLKMIATRYQTLRGEGAISEQDAMDKQTASRMGESELAATRQQLEAARFAARQSQERLRAAEAGGRQVDVSISQASVAQTRASIRQIEAQLAQTVIKAPSDGVITKRNAEAGEIPSMGQSLFTMAKEGELELRTQVQEIDLPGIKAGAKVTITPAAPGLKPIVAVVREISPVVDAKTRLGTVYVDVAGTQGLKEGMYASAQIETGTRFSLAVPTKGIRAEESEKVVFVLSGNKATRRPIVTGNNTGDMVEVKSGLAEGELVIIAGAGFLKDGDVVDVSLDSSRPATTNENSNGAVRAPEDRVEHNGLQ